MNAPLLLFCSLRQHNIPISHCSSILTGRTGRTREGGTFSAVLFYFLFFPLLPIYSLLCQACPSLLPPRPTPPSLPSPPYNCLCLPVDTSTLTYTHLHFPCMPACHCLIVCPHPTPPIYTIPLLLCLPYPSCLPLFTSNPTPTYLPHPITYHPTTQTLCYVYCRTSIFLCFSHHFSPPCLATQPFFCHLAFTGHWDSWVERNEYSR